jgi:hypothetical protein
MNSGFTEEICTPTSPESDKITVEDFVAYVPAHSYLFIPCREPWIGSGVDARVPPIPVLKKNGQPKVVNGKPVLIKATKWLDRNRPIEQLTWCPGEPMLIADRLVVDGGWIERKGVTCFNLYRPPCLKLGNANEAEPWLKHVHKVYEADDARHCIHWFAHRVQHPQQKINHGLVLGGPQGIGKDSMLEPVKNAIGAWNFHDISPTHLLESFNSFAKSVILRVNEARDLGEINRFSFYDRTKIYTAAPPDVLRINEKYLREYYVFNVVGFIITTNHKTDGIYLPADDRRHYVAWSERTKDDFEPGYWNDLWSWYRQGGFGHVAAYLSELDISGFDPNAPPPKTPAFWDIVGASSAPEDAALADVIDAAGNPQAITPKQLIAVAAKEPKLVEIAEWLMDRRNRRALPHRMERCGYSSIRNKNAADGYWLIDGTRQPVYVKNALSEDKKWNAASALMKQHSEGADGNDENG